MTEQRTRNAALTMWDVPDVVEEAHPIDVLRKCADDIGALAGGGLCTAAA